MNISWSYFGDARVSKSRVMQTHAMQMVRSLEQSSRVDVDKCIRRLDQRTTIEVYKVKDDFKVFIRTNPPKEVKVVSELETKTYIAVILGVLDYYMGYPYYPNYGQGDWFSSQSGQGYYALLEVIRVGGEITSFEPVRNPVPEGSPEGTIGAVKIFNTLAEPSDIRDRFHKQFTCVNGRFTTVGDYLDDFEFGLSHLNWAYYNDPTCTYGVLYYPQGDLIHEYVVERKALLEQFVNSQRAVRFYAPYEVDGNGDPIIPVEHLSVDPPGVVIGDTGTYNHTTVCGAADVPWMRKWWQDGDYYRSHLEGPTYSAQMKIGLNSTGVGFITTPLKRYLRGSGSGTLSPFYRYEVRDSYDYYTESEQTTEDERIFASDTRREMAQEQILKGILGDFHSFDYRYYTHFNLIITYDIGTGEVISQVQTINERTFTYADGGWQVDQFDDFVDDKLVLHFRYAHLKYSEHDDIAETTTSWMEPEEDASLQAGFIDYKDGSSSTVDYSTMVRNTALEAGLQECVDALKEYFISLNTPISSAGIVLALYGKTEGV